MDSRPPADAVTPQSPPPVAPADSFAVAPAAPPPDGGNGAAPVSQRHPPAIWFFFWGEFAERSSYYGMRTILFLYMTTALIGLNGRHLADTDASPIYAAFKMACYFLPLLGGFIADRWLGKYWTIVGFSVPYVLGHFILGIPNEPAMFVALLLLAGGSGVIKPNISTLMGQTYDQKRPGQEQLRSAAFLWFYFAINIGALISQLALPVIRNQYILYHLPSEVRARAQSAAILGEDVVPHLSPEDRARVESGELKGQDILKRLPEAVRARLEANGLQGKDIATVAPPLIRHHYLVAALPEGLRERAEAAAARGEDLLTELSRNDLTAYTTIVLQGQPLAAAGCSSYALSDPVTEVPPEVRAEAEEAARQGEAAATSLLQSAYAVAFQFPAWLMVLSLAIFALGKPFYAKEKRERHVLTREERRLQWQTLGRLFAIFALVVLFWFGYEHNDTLWVAFTRDYVDLKVPFVDVTIAPDQLQFLNALFVIILVPTFTFLFGRFDPKVKVFTPMRKVLAGFVLTAAAIGIMSAAGFLAQGHTGTVLQDGKEVMVATAKVSLFWPAAAIIVLTFGEVLLYGTMLELAYTAAPKSMKGFITACFLVTNALGNFLNIYWTRMYGGSLKDEASARGPLSPGVFFGLTALVVVAAAVAFVFIGKRFERIQAEAAAAGVT